MGSRDVIGHVTIRLPGVEFLWVVHSDHVFIWHRYRDMTPQIWGKGRERGREEGRVGKGKGKRKVQRRGSGREKRKKEKGKGKGKGKEKGMEKGK